MPPLHAHSIVASASYPCCAAYSPSARIIAAAPSLTPGALPAVDRAVAFEWTQFRHRFEARVGTNGFVAIDDNVPARPRSRRVRTPRNRA